MFLKSSIYCLQHRFSYYTRLHYGLNNNRAMRLFFLMSELMNDAFSIQLCVLVDVHQDQSRHALRCHCRAQIVLETQHCDLPWLSIQTSPSVV